MKKYLSILLIFFSFNLVAQQKPSIDKSEIRAAKLAFMEKEMNLTAAESAAFWPVYQEFEKQRMEIKREMGKLGIAHRGEQAANLSADDLDKMMEKFFELRQKELDLEKLYHQKFRAILSAEKTAAAYKAERKFQMEVLRTLKQSRPEGAPRR